MPNFKIVIPVTAQVEYFRTCIEKIPDKTKLCVLNNYTNPEIEAMCQILETQGAEIHRFPWNLGAGPSFNFGLKMLDKHGRNLDFVVILSPACLFNTTVDDFVNQVAEEEAKKQNYYYTAQSQEIKTDMHCMAFTKKMYEEIGLFDENLWPYGYDDQDIQWRMHLLGGYVTCLTQNYRSSRPTGQGVTSDPRLFSLHMENTDRQYKYYVRKWGGPATMEVFKTPFNSPYLTPRDWTLELNDFKFLDDLP